MKSQVLSNTVLNSAPNMARTNVLAPSPEDCVEPVKNDLQPPTRFAFIDGLRGIAALSVVFFHLYLMTKLNHPAALTAIPDLLCTVVSHGDRGVQVFFTLSGFVIAHSLRKMTTRGEALIFMVKRFLRLCPAYWLVLCAVFFGAQVMGRAGLNTTLHKLTPGDLLASMFYCQYLVHANPVLGPAWTLCMEMSFYLFMSGLAILCAFSKNLATRKAVTTVILFAIAMLQIPHIATTGWSLFAAGYLCYTKITDGKFSNLFFVLVASILGVAVVFSNLSALVGVLTAVLIYATHRCGMMNKFLAQPVFQYLGTISYSLYLVNMNVCALTTKLADKFAHQNPVLNCLWFGATILLCIVSAHVLYKFVEGPSHRFSKQFLLGREQRI
ncbi:MAG TPA: acyltransferase [Drouetiella sp.]